MKGDKTAAPAMREYEFNNLITPNGILKFSFGPTTAIKTYTLIPGGKYSLPDDVYEHISSIGTKNDDWRPDGTGVMRAQTVSVSPHYSLRPTRW